MMEGGLDKRRQQIADRFLQSTFGLWNALLTVNGVLMAAFSAVYATSLKAGTWTVFALIGSCVLSLLLLSCNFVVTKATYYRIGQVVSDEDIELSDQQRKKDIGSALFRHRFIQVSEWACLTLLLVEAGLVVAIVAGY
jgi:uncharacterized membrane protein